MLSSMLMWETGTFRLISEQTNLRLELWSSLVAEGDALLDIKYLSFLSFPRTVHRFHAIHIPCTAALM